MGDRADAPGNRGGGRGLRQRWGSGPLCHLARRPGHAGAGLEYALSQQRERVVHGCHEHRGGEHRGRVPGGYLLGRVRGLRPGWGSGSGGRRVVRGQPTLPQQRGRDIHECHAQRVGCGHVDEPGVCASVCRYGRRSVPRAPVGRGLLYLALLRKQHGRDLLDDDAGQWDGGSIPMGWATRSGITTTMGCSIGM